MNILNGEKNMEETKFVLAKCANCGKMLKTPENAVTVFCISCKEWTKIIHEDNKEKNEGEKNGWLKPKS